MKRLTFLAFAILFVLSCSKKPAPPKNPTTNLFYDKAFKFRDTLNISDSAYYYFNKAKEVFLQQRDSLGTGKCLANMAIIATDKGDYFGGQENSLNAASYFNKKDEKQFVYISSNFNNLAMATHKLGDFNSALKFYNSAIEFSKKDTLANLLYLNNKANLYQEDKNYGEALKIYEEVLSRTAKVPKEYARVLTNISVTKSLKEPNYNPLPNFLKALSIREKENDIRGKNSSYSHLADYYSSIKPDSSLFYARKMYQIAKMINNAFDQSMALEKLILFTPKSESNHFFEIYKKLTDSSEKARNIDRNQFALIRYDIEKHKVDNLKLQKDNNEKTYQLIFLASGTVIIIGLGIFWYRKRKQRLQMEAENTIKENQLRTSKKVHDVVANGLYRVMNKVEYQEEIDKENLLDEIEELYEKSRDISYEKPVGPASNFHQKIAALLHAFNSHKTQVVINGNTAALWKKVNTTAQYEIEHILQELMVNMGKHSQASEVTVSFEEKQQQIHIFYKDNGIGIEGEVKSISGLRNTETRIKSLNGQLTFETELEKGLKVHFSFPVS